MVILHGYSMQKATTQRRQDNVKNGEVFAQVIPVIKEHFKYSYI